MGIKKGDRADDFILQNTRGNNVSLRDLVSDGKVLLLFFPLAFSSSCTEELCRTRDNMKLYNALKTTVAAISVDSFFTLREYKRANNLNFILLSDFNREISRRFESLYEDFYGMKGVSKRSAFVINSDLEIEYAEILDDADQMPDFKQIQKVLSG